MADARTPSTVDRSMVVHVIQAVRGDIPEEARRAHLGNKARSHLLLAELLRTDPKKVNLQLFRQALRGGVVLKVREFSSKDVLERVRALGGQFATAQMAKVPGGETLESQKDSVIKFWNEWMFKPEETARLTIEPSIASQIVYLTNLVEDSLSCTFDKVTDGEHRCVEEVISTLPDVSGLRWLVGNLPTINHVLADHLEATGVHLLPNVYTHTTDSYKHPEYGLRRLIAGYFGSRRVGVVGMGPGESPGHVGLFVLGVPA